MLRYDLSEFGGPPWQAERGLQLGIELVDGSRAATRKSSNSASRRAIVRRARRSGLRRPCADPGTPAALQASRNQLPNPPTIGLPSAVGNDIGEVARRACCNHGAQGEHWQGDDLARLLGANRDPSISADVLASETHHHRRVAGR